MSMAEIPHGLVNNYWHNIGRLDLLEPYPYMAFVQEEQEMLYFRLTAAYSWDMNGFLLSSLSSTSVKSLILPFSTSANTQLEPR